MIVNDTNQASDAQPSGGQPIGGQPQSQQRGAWSFHQPGMLNSAVAPGLGSEYFQKMRAAMAEIAKDLVEGFEVGLIGLNRQQFTQLRFSCILFCMKRDNVVSYHTLILEATGEEVRPLERSINGVRMTISRVTGDAYDDALAQIAHGEVLKNYSNATIFQSDATVIPRNIRHDDKIKIEEIVRNTAMADYSVIAMATKEFNPLNLVEMDREARLVVDASYGNYGVTDIVGNPQRSSIILTMSSTKKAQGNPNMIESLNQADTTVQVCRMAGFMNPIYAPVQPMHQFGFQQNTMGVQRPTQTYAAEFVITSLETPYATSPAALLLALSSYLSMTENDNWLQFMLPHSRSNSSHTDEDMGDLGSLNVLANINNETDNGIFGSEIETREFANDLNLFSKFLVAMFRQGLAISIDCPIAAPQSWYLGTFAAAASGDAEAYNLIYNSANELTNGRFQDYFKHGKEIFNHVMRVPLGHYNLSNGNLADIRNVDLTAVSTRFAKDPRMIVEWCNTFSDSGDPFQHASRRERIIQAVTNESAVITGAALRCTLSDEFTKALSAAIRACNPPITINTPLAADALRSGVAVPSYIQSSLTSGTNTFQNNFQRPQVHPFQYGAAPGFRRY